MNWDEYSGRRGVYEGGERVEERELREVDEGRPETPEMDEGLPETPEPPEVDEGRPETPEMDEGLPETPEPPEYNENKEEGSNEQESEELAKDEPEDKRQEQGEESETSEGNGDRNRGFEDSDRREGLNDEKQELAEEEGDEEHECFLEHPLEGEGKSDGGADLRREDVSVERASEKESSPEVDINVDREIGERRTPDGNLEKYFMETSSVNDERTGTRSEKTFRFARVETSEGDEILGVGREEGVEFKAWMQNDEGWFDEVYVKAERAGVLQSWETDRPVDASLVQFPPEADMKFRFRITDNPDLKNLRLMGESTEFWTDKDGYPTVRNIKWLIFQRDSGEGRGKLPEESYSKSQVIGYKKSFELQLKPGEDGILNRKDSLTRFFPFEKREGQGVSLSRDEGGEGTGDVSHGMKLLLREQRGEDSKSDYSFKGEFTEFVYSPVDGGASDKIKTEAGDAGDKAAETSGLAVEGEEKSSEKTVEAASDETGEMSSIGETEESTSEKEKSAQEAVENVEEKFAENSKETDGEAEISSASKTNEDMTTEDIEDQILVEVGETEKVSVKDVLRMIGKGIFGAGNEEKYYERLREKDVKFEGEKINRMLFEERRIPREIYQALESLAREGEKSDGKTTPEQKAGMKQDANNVIAASEEEGEQKQQTEENKKLNPLQRKLLEIWKRLGMNPDSKLAAAIEEIYELLGKEELLVYLYNGRVNPWGRRVSVASLVDVLEILVEAFRKAGNAEKFFEWVRKRTGRLIFEYQVNEEFARRRLDEEILRAALEFVYETKEAISEREKLLEQNTKYILKRLREETSSTSQTERLLKPQAESKKRIKQPSHAAFMEEHTRNKKKFSNEQLIQLHQKGLSGKEIAERLGVDRVTVFRRAKKLGLKFKGNLKSKFTDEQLTKLYEQGMPVNEIAKQLGVKGQGSSYVYRRMRRLGLKTSARKFTDEQLIELHEQGLTRREIAQKLGAHRDVVWRRMRRLGLKTSARKFTDEQLTQLHEQGLREDEVAGRLGVNKDTVYKHAKRLGIRFKSNAKRKFTDEQLAQLYEQGLSVNEIAKEFGVKNSSYIYQHLKRLGLKTSARKFTDEQLRQLHKQGLTVKEVAERLKVHRITVQEHAKRLGLKFKSLKKFSDKQLMQLHKQGLTAKEAAERLKVHRSNILRRAKRLRLKLKVGINRRFSDEQLIQLHEQGLTVKEAAERLKVHTGTIRKHGKRLGLINFSLTKKEKVELVLLKCFKNCWFNSNDVRKQYINLFGEDISQDTLLLIINKIYFDNRKSILVRTGSPGYYRYRLKTEEAEDKIKDLGRAKEKIGNSEEILQILEWLIREDPEIEVLVENFGAYIVSGRKLCSLILRALEKAGSQEKLEEIFGITKLAEKIRLKRLRQEELSKIAEYLSPLEMDEKPKTVPSILIPFYEWMGGQLNPWPVLRLYEKTRIWETLHKIEHLLSVMGIRYLRTHCNTLLIQNPKNPWGAYEYMADITKGEWYHQPTVNTYMETEGENGLKKLLKQAIGKLEQQNKDSSYKQLAWELNSLGADLNEGKIKGMSEAGWVSVRDVYALFAFLEREDLHSLREQTIEELLEKGKITKRKLIVLPQETLRELNKALKKHGYGYFKNFTETLGLVPVTVRYYFRGLSKIPIENLEKICRNLGLETNYHKLYYRKSESKLGSWDSYEKTTEIINENTIVERISIVDPKNFEEIKLTLIHTREENEGVKTSIPELNLEVEPLETPFYLQSPRTFIGIDRNKQYEDGMDILQYMLKKGTEKAGDKTQLAEILKTGPECFHHLLSHGEKKLLVSTLLKLALYTNMNLEELGKYITQVGQIGKIKGKKLEVYITKLDNPEGALFVVCIFGDGSSSKVRRTGKYLHVDFYNREEEYIEVMREVSEKVYSYKPDKNESEQKGVPMYFLGWGDSIAQTLVRVGMIPGLKTRINIRIPEKIRNGNKEIKMAFIIGLILCEANLGKELRISLNRDVSVSWQEAKELLQQNGLNFNSPRELNEYLKEHQELQINLKELPTSLKEEKHNILEDTATIIKELLETDKDKDKEEENVKLALRTLIFRPNRVTGKWLLTINVYGTRMLHKILNGFPGYKELMYKNEQVVGRNFETYKKKLTPEDLNIIWNISEKNEKTYKNKKCYSVSFNSLPPKMKEKLEPSIKFLEKQRRCAEKTVEVLIDGKKVKVKGMPSTINCEVLLFPDRSHLVRWVLKRPEVDEIKNMWRRIKAVVKEKMTRKERLEINMEEIMDESREG